MAEITIEDQMEALNDMFQSAGWELFIEDMTVQLKGIDNVDGVKGEQQLGHRQGMCQILRGVIGYEEIAKQVHEQAGSDEETV